MTKKELIKQVIEELENMRTGDVIPEEVMRKAIQEKKAELAVWEIIDKALSLMYDKCHYDFETFLTEHSDGVYNGVQTVRITDSNWNKFVGKETSK